MMGDNNNVRAGNDDDNNNYRDQYNSYLHRHRTARIAANQGNGNRNNSQYHAATTTSTGSGTSSSTAGAASFLSTLSSFLSSSSSSSCSASKFKRIITMIGFGMKNSIIKYRFVIWIILLPIFLSVVHLWNIFYTRQCVLLHYHHNHNYHHNQALNDIQEQNPSSSSSMVVNGGIIPISEIICARPIILPSSSRRGIGGGVGTLSKNNKNINGNIKQQMLQQQEEEEGEETILSSSKSWPPPTITSLWENYIVDQSSTSTSSYDNYYGYRKYHYSHPLVTFDGIRWKVKQDHEQQQQQQINDHYAKRSLSIPFQFHIDNKEKEKLSFNWQRRLQYNTSNETSITAVEYTNSSFSISAIKRATSAITVDTKTTNDVGPINEFTTLSIVDFAPSIFGWWDDDNDNKRNNNNKDTDTSSTTTVSSGYGFRRNNAKRNSSNNINSSNNKGIFPMTTAIWLIVNIGLYILYWNSRTDPSTVCLNDEVVRIDYGRAFSGHLAHFDLWHIGFNMMSLQAMGPLLETSHGSIPLLFWTCSFFPLLTLIVLFLLAMKRRYFSSNGSTTTAAASSGSMVGFSGILFAYMVVTTLQTSGKTCPISFLFPNLCFDTYHFFNGRISISLGPIVQLLFIQIMLRNASFIGHLAGILLGFLWHTWDTLHEFIFILPTLEYIQPCILFPILWIIGKQRYMIDSLFRLMIRDRKRNNHHGKESYNGYIDDDNDEESYNGNHDNNNLRRHHHYHPRRGVGNDKFNDYNAVLMLMTIHIIGMMIIFIFDIQHVFILSEVLILFILFVFVTYHKHLSSILTNNLQQQQPQRLSFTNVATISSITTTTTSSSPWSTNDNIHNNSNTNYIGMVSRGLIVLIFITWFTDNMTIGGWIMTRNLWNRGKGINSNYYYDTITCLIFFIFIIFRWILWYVLIFHLWKHIQEQEQQRNSSRDSTSSSSSATHFESSGIWHHVVIEWIGLSDMIQNCTRLSRCSSTMTTAVTSTTTMMMITTTTMTTTTTARGRSTSPFTFLMTRCFRWLQTVFSSSPISQQHQQPQQQQRSGTTTTTMTIANGNNSNNSNNNNYRENTNDDDDPNQDEDETNNNKNSNDGDMKKNNKYNKNRLPISKMDDKIATNEKAEISSFL